jgi:4-amino-4-deoxy-L-arabinose transferase-like glycosyltransferase
MAPLVALALPWLWRSLREAPVIFLLAWIVPTWLVFEVVATKLPHYVLPTYPAIAIATALAILAGGLSRALWGRYLTLLIPLIAVVIPIAGFVAVVYYEGRFAWLMLPFILLAGALGYFAWKALNARRDVDAVGLAGLAACAVYAAIYAAGMPALPTLWPSPRLAAVAQSMECADPRFATAGYREPSLVFLVGTTLEMTSGAGAADFLAKGPCRMAFVDKRDEEAFQKRAGELALTPALSTRVTGINLNGGRELDIGVYRVP